MLGGPSHRPAHRLPHRAPSQPPAPGPSLGPSLGPYCAPLIPLAPPLISTRHQALGDRGGQVATSTTAAWLAEEARREASRPGSPPFAAAAAAASPPFVAGVVTGASGDLSQPQAREEELAAAGSGSEGLFGGLRQALSTAPQALSQGRDVQVKVEPQWSEDDNGDRVAYALEMEQPPPAVTRLDLTRQSNEGARSPRVSKARHMAAALCPGCNSVHPTTLWAQAATLCTHTQVVAICIQVRLDVPRQEGAELTEERADQRDTEVERQRRLYKQWREAEEVPQPYVLEAATLC